MRPFVYAHLFHVPLREAAARLERLALREERDLVRLADPTRREHAIVVIGEVREEARRIRALPPQ